jgi:hypothetical protein
MPDLEQLSYRELAELNLIDEKALRDHLIIEDFKQMKKDGLTVDEIIEVCSKKNYCNQYLQPTTIRDIYYKHK